MSRVLKETPLAKFPFGHPKSSLRLSAKETSEDHQKRLRFLNALSALFSHDKLEKKLSESYIGTVRRNASSDGALFVDLASSPEVMTGYHDLFKAEVSGLGFRV